MIDSTKDQLQSSWGAQNPETSQLQKIAGVVMLLLETKDGHHLTVIKDNQALIEGKM